MKRSSETVSEFAIRMIEFFGTRYQLKRKESETDSQYALRLVEHDRAFGTEAEASSSGEYIPPKVPQKKRGTLGLEEDESSSEIFFNDTGRYLG